MKYLILFFLLITSAVFSQNSTPEAYTKGTWAGWKYDPYARINSSLNDTRMGPYQLQIADPYLFFADPAKPLMRDGCYNWRLQHWEWVRNTMNYSAIDLKKLYISINLDLVPNLNRDTNNLAPSAIDLGKTAPAYNKQEAKLARRTEGIPADWAYDKNAEINPMLNGEAMGPYTLQIEAHSPLLFFGYDKNRPLLRAACYDWEMQYWYWKDRNFDPGKVNLAALYRRIDLSKTTLDRPRPAWETMSSVTNIPNTPYNYSRDIPFSNFIEWCRRANTPAGTIDFFLKAANHPAKRGARRIHEYGKQYSLNVIGIMFEVYKPVSQKHVFNGSEYDQTNMLAAGGMEAYFIKREGNYVPAANWSYSVFRDNPVVPVTVVELSPVEPPLSQNRILRGNALGTQVKKDLESAFGKQFNVTVVSRRISYKKLGEPGRLPILTHMDLVMDEVLHPGLPTNSLCIYYFTDVSWLKNFDKDMTHPLSRGPYGTDWMKYRFTIMHEMGHSLSLMHHFDESANSSDINNHISPACIMNYRYKSPVFCELCRYGLGIEPQVKKSK